MYGMVTIMAEEGDMKLKQFWAESPNGKRYLTVRGVAEDRVIYDCSEPVEGGALQVIGRNFSLSLERFKLRFKGVKL